MRFLTILCVTLMSTVVLSGDHSTGNGGDIIRKLFIDAKHVAAQKLRRLKPCSFDGQNDMEAIRFLLDNASTLIDEVVHSAHYWTVDQQKTCAFTSREKRAGIYLSYPICHNMVDTLEEAAFILIHEATHHLGVTDERFSDRVALAAISAVDRESCPRTGDEIYHPNYCQGASMNTAEMLRYFVPGASEASFTTAQAKRRERRCNKATGCESNWTEVSVELDGSAGSYPVKQFQCKFAVRGNGSYLRNECHDGKYDWLDVNEFNSLKYGRGYFYFVFKLAKVGPDATHGTLDGRMTNHCLWYKLESNSKEDITGFYIQSETVFYSNYSPR